MSKFRQCFFQKMFIKSFQLIIVVVMVQYSNCAKDSYVAAVVEYRPADSDAFSSPHQVNYYLQFLKIYTTTSVARY